MEEFINSSGKRYAIVEERGLYTLMVEKVKEDKTKSFEISEPFVVAFRLNKEKSSWVKGRYYASMESAMESFESLTAMSY